MYMNKANVAAQNVERCFGYSRQRVESIPVREWKSDVKMV
jgi:hypothetical protein